MFLSVLITPPRAIILESNQFVQVATRGDSLIAKIMSSAMRDFETVTAIKLTMLNAVREQSPMAVVVDLGNVHFIGSVGFLAFLSLRREPVVQQVILCNMDPNVRQLFSLCKLVPDGSGMKAPLAVANTVDEALAMTQQA